MLYIVCHISALSPRVRHKMAIASPRLCVKCRELQDGGYDRMISRRLTHPTSRLVYSRHTSVPIIYYPTPISRYDLFILYVITWSYVFCIVYGVGSLWKLPKKQKQETAIFKQLTKKKTKNKSKILWRWMGRTWKIQVTDLY